MNLNKSARFWSLPTLLSLFLFSALVIGFVCLFLFSKSWNDIPGDIGDYVGAMEACYVSDWHSPLFYWERVVWRKICLVIGWGIGCDLVCDVSWQSNAFALICHIFLFAVVAYLLRKVLISDSRYTWVIIPWILVFFVIHRYGINHYWGNLESYNLVMLSLMIPVIMGMRSATPLTNSILLLLLFFLCIHSVDYRRNAWILMPLIAYAAACQQPFHGRKSLKRIFTTILILAFIGIGTIGVGKMIPCAKMHSASVMLASDIKIAAHLLNSLDEEEKWLADNCGLLYPERSRNRLRADSGNRPVNVNQYDPIERVSLNAEQWAALKSRYIIYWREHAGEMLLARALSVHHLYLTIHTRPFVKRWILSKYPHLEEDDFNAPVGFVWEDNMEPILHIITLGVLIISLIGYACFLLQAKGAFSPFDEFIIIVMAGAMMYYLSYLIIVPAPFSRYLGTSMLVFWLTLPLIWTRCFILYRLRSAHSL